MDTIEVTVRGSSTPRKETHEAYDWDVDALGNLTLKGQIGEGQSGARKNVATYLTATRLKVERKEPQSA